MGKRAPGFESKSASDKKKIEIDTLKDLIHRDKTEAKLFEDNLNQNGVFDNEDEHSQKLVSKLKSQKYRIKIKEILLNDLSVS